MTIYQNISEDGKEEIYERLFCSQELTTGIHIYLIFLSLFNFLLAICSSLGNILILIALHKETCLPRRPNCFSDPWLQLISSLVSFLSL